MTRIIELPKKTDHGRLRSTRWAIGLEWQHFQGKPRAATRQAYQYADDVGLKATCHARLPGSGKHAIGLGDLTGRIPRAPSLAASIAANNPDDAILGRFPLDDGSVFLLAVAYGDVYIHGDMVGSAETIDNQLDELYDTARPESPVDQWDKVLDPSDAQEAAEQLATYLAGVRPRAFLAARSSRLPRGGAAIFVVGVAVAGVGVYLYLDHRAAVEERERQERIEEAQEEIDGEDEPEAPHADEPWPDEMIAACLDPLGSIEMAQDGWKFERYTCSLDRVQSHWERVGGLFSERPYSAAFNQDDPNQARAAIDADLPDGRGSAARDLLTADDAIARMLDIAVNHHWESSVSQDPIQGASDPEQTVTHATVQWEFKGPAWPNDVGTALRALPGAVIENIQWRIDERQWVIEGVLYVED